MHDMQYRWDASSEVIWVLVTMRMHYKMPGFTKQSSMHIYIMFQTLP